MPEKNLTMKEIDFYRKFNWLMSEIGGPLWPAGALI